MYVPEFTGISDGIFCAYVCDSACVKNRFSTRLTWHQYLLRCRDAEGYSRVSKAEK